MYIFKAGVVGAGTMGAEIAQVIGFSGLPVVLKDVDGAALARGMERARAIYQRRVERGRMTPQEMASRLDLITPTLDYADFHDVDLVIEAVPERLPLKLAVFRDLDRFTPPTAILASNTSALSISAMAAATGRPHRVVGLHFFNPASVMKLVEVVAGRETSSETLDTAIAFAESLRKLPVRVRECPGFLVNRVLLAAMAEVLRYQEEAGADPARVDAVLHARAGVPMGPFTLADMLGLDVVLDVAETLEAAYGERMRPTRWLRDLVAAGHLGVKTGRGFYAYTETGEAVADRSSGGVPDEDDLVERFQAAQFLEACRCLAEGVASARDIDLAMRAGAGLPSGPLARADEDGLDVVQARLARLAARHGDRFAVPALLERLVAEGRLGRASGRGFHEYEGAGG